MILVEGQSNTRDQDIAAERYKDSWIVFSASNNDNGFVKCYAIKGRRPDIFPENTIERIYMIPSKEYDYRKTPIGFVIDESIYQPISETTE